MWIYWSSSVSQVYPFSDSHKFQNFLWSMYFSTKQNFLWLDYFSTKEATHHLCYFVFAKKLLGGRCSSDTSITSNLVMGRKLIWKILYFYAMQEKERVLIQIIIFAVLFFLILKIYYFQKEDSKETERRRNWIKSTVPQTIVRYN